MKRDLIYLTLLAALFTAAKVMAQNDGTSSRQGLTSRTIEVGFTKTVHILFPAPVTYIDIGSMAIIAGKADGAENVVRVKAAVRDFAEETNLTVITEDGGFYTFDARYAENPATSTIEIAAAESPAAQPASASEPARTDEGRVLLREVGRERPATIKRVLSDIYRQNRADVKGIHTRKYGVEVEVRGIYVHNDVIYLHVQIANNTNISFEVDYRRFVVADRKAAKRTAQQQRIIEPLRVCNDPSIVRGHQRQRIVFALPKLTLEEDKILLLEIAEKDGARHQYLEISSKELLGAKKI
ncbi:MAG TPA: conjugative transposon protein TraN [Candidatus Alistipes faecavium]|nr:conjugative transposon protein TraN [Candidatus Alistipes faecavium]